MNGRLIQLGEIGLFRWEIAEGSSGPCNIVQLWHPQCPIHKHASAQLQVNSAGQIFLTCLHETCLRTSNGTKWFLSTLPTHLRPAVAPASDVNLNSSDLTRKHLLDPSLLTVQTRRDPSLTIKRRRADRIWEQCLVESEGMQESSSASSLQMTSLPRVSLASDDANLVDKNGWTQEEPCDGAADQTQQEMRKARTRSCDTGDPADTIHWHTTAQPMYRALQTRSRSLLQVEATKQADEPEAFQPWHVTAIVTPGPFGGRLGSHAPHALL
jgi:hypothetical protein